MVIMGDRRTATVQLTTDAEVNPEAAEMLYVY